MSKRGRGQRAELSTRAVVIGVICAVLLAVGSWAIDTYGGEGFLPDWSRLYDSLGLETAAPVSQTPQEGQATVTFWDVGQGDSVLISSGGAYCLIDAGTSQSADALVEDLIAGGVEKLDLVVMTHPHADHIGGMDEVLDTFEVGTLLLPDLSYADTESGMLAKVLQTAEDTGTPCVQAERGWQQTVGEGTLTVVYAGLVPEEGKEPDLNDTSLCVRYELGQFSFLCTGDAEANAEEELVLTAGGTIASTLFKAGHHGSDTSNTQTLLWAVRPQVAVVSCGLDNDYGHPHAEVLQRFADNGVEVYRTDEQGTITVTGQADGSWSVRTAAGETAEPQVPAA